MRAFSPGVVEMIHAVQPAARTAVNRGGAVGGTIFILQGMLLGMFMLKSVLNQKQ